MEQQAFRVAAAPVVAMAWALLQWALANTHPVTPDALNDYETRMAWERMATQAVTDALKSPVRVSAFLSGCGREDAKMKFSLTFDGLKPGRDGDPQRLVVDLTQNVISTKPGESRALSLQHRLLPATDRWIRSGIPPPLRPPRSWRGGCHPCWPGGNRSPG